MPTWKKVVVSGSQAELATLKVDSLKNGIVTGSATDGTLGIQAINGTGNIVATTGATGLSASGSFSGSFQGLFTGTATQVSNNLTQGTGITSFSYNGSSTQTVAVSGTVGMATNAITKWTGTAFTASTLTDNGTTITGASSIQLTGANSSLTGSFTGSFRGDGSGLTGVTAQASFALTFGEGIGLNAQGSSSYNGNQPVTITVSGAADLTDGRHIRWDNTANKLTNSLIYDDGTNLQITGSTIIVSGASTAFVITGSVRSLGGFTGSLLGTASYVTASNVFGPLGSNSVLSASYAVTSSYALTASFVNNLVQNLQITGSSVIISGASAALIVTGSVSSTGGFTGSLFGTASYVTASSVFGPFGSGSVTSASYAVTASYAANGGTLANSLFAGLGLSGSSFNGGSPATFSISGAAQLTTNTLPKWTGTGLNNSNITDTGTLITLGSSTVAVSIPGNLTVAGTASFTNTDSLFVADQFIALASGSNWATTPKQAGIIAIVGSSATGMSGSALFLDTVGNHGRWAVTSSLNATASSATGVNEYVVSVTVNQAGAPAAATKPVWGSDTNNTNAGSMWVQTNGDIYIYS